MADILGNDVGIGDRIVYPVRHGARVTMQTGTIIEAKCRCGTYLTASGFIACDDGYQTARVQKPDGKIVTLTSFKNVVVVK